MSETEEKGVTILDAVRRAKEVSVFDVISIKYSCS